MSSASRRARTWLAAAAAALAVGLLAAPPASAQSAGLSWETCGVAPGVQCATQKVPLDYDRPNGPKIDIAVARVPAKDQDRKIGSLFFNFGGPGGPHVDFLQATAGAGLFDALNERFDIVGFDPRGVGQSSPAIDCRVNQETDGPSSQPFYTPLTIDVPAYLAKVRRYIDRCASLNGRILEHVSTADVARDMDVLRQAVGDAKLTYLGYSYGTFLGATYAALFPNRHRALALDGAVDLEGHLSDPLRGSNEQAAGFERALGRFFQACAADQATCLGFGGNDPHAAYDDLVERANASPIPAPNYTPDPRPIDGDDINAVAPVVTYAKQFWPDFATALAAAAAGDGSIIRLLVDLLVYPRDPETGAYDPLKDRFVAIYAAEANWPTNIRTYLREAEQAWGMFDHFYAKYGELHFALWPARARDVYRGPFRVSESSPTVLVIGTRYDPATPYRWSVRARRQLGNARLLTMRGDGHTAYGGNSPCIDAAVNAYLIERTLPAPATVCRQEVPFAQPPVPASTAATTATRRALPHVVGPIAHRRAIVR